MDVDVGRASAAASIGGGASVAAADLLHMISGNEALIGLAFAGTGLAIQAIISWRKDRRELEEHSVKMRLYAEKLGDD